MHKSSLYVTSVTRGRTTGRKGFTVQWHLKMRITKQIFQPQKTALIRSNQKSGGQGSRTITGVTGLATQALCSGCQMAEHQGKQLWPPGIKMQAAETWRSAGFSARVEELD